MARATDTVVNFYNIIEEFWVISQSNFGIFPNCELDYTVECPQCELDIAEPLFDDTLMAE